MIPDSGNADQFIRVFNRLVDRKLARLRPRMATVDDTDSRGNPYLRLWDEDDDTGRPPKVGRARTAGTEYRKGNKVIVHEVDGGDYVVLGKVVGGDDDEPDAERVITSAMLQENAVDARALAPGAVTTAALDPNLKIGASQIEFGTIGTNHFASDVATDLSTLRTAVSSLNSSNTGIGGQIAALQAAVAALQRRVDTLPQFSTFALKAEVSAVQTSLDNQRTRLDRRIDAVADELDRHKKRQNH